LKEEAMSHSRLKYACALLIGVVAAILCGCAPTVISDAARTSTASFINNVFSAAVNAAIAP